MEVNNVVSASTTATTYGTTANKNTAAPKTEEKSTAAETKTVDENAAGVYEPSKEAQNTETAKKTAPDKATIDRLLKEADTQVANFRKLLESMITKQGKKVNDVLGQIKKGENPMVEVDDETRKKAQELISEDGYYGVKKTTERIMDFAKAIGGDDPKMIEKLRKAVKQGFGAAMTELDLKKMPEITQKTYDSVMKEFDDWAASVKKVEDPVNPVK